MKLYHFAAIGVAISLPGIFALTSLRSPRITYSDYPVPANDNTYDLGGGYKGDTYEYDPKGTYHDDVPAKGTLYTCENAANVCKPPKKSDDAYSYDDSSYGGDSYSYDGSKK